MTTAIDTISWIQSIGFTLIALAVAVAWLRQRTTQHAWLALAIGLLGAISLVGRIEHVTGYVSLLLGHVLLLAFLASGCALALFRNSVVPLPRPALAGLVVTFAAVGTAGFVINLPSGLSPSPTAAQWALVWAFVLFWCASVAEPGIRFWIASRGRPVIQRTRLRALSAGYCAIVVILLVAFGISIVAGPHLVRNEQYQLIVGLLGLGTVPVLYVGFAPPRWLRRIWRDREEEALRRATGELLLAADPAAVAERSVDWALRLVGADRGVIVGPDGRVLARREVDDALEAELGALDPGDAPHLAAAGARGRGSALVAPLPVLGGRAMIAVLPGPFTPVFGADELVRLGEYAVSVASALERTRLVVELRRQISERRRDQRELAHRAEELQRSNAALEEFAYIASHDLQEPLRMVASYLELLERRHRPDLDEEALEFLGFAVDGARRMQALINDLLLYSRSGGLAEEPQPTDCNAVVERVLANLQSTIREAGASVVAERLPVVTAHPTELTQVFQNLVGNALKFTGDRPPEVRIGAELDGDSWAFSVRDNGIGIEPRHAERIFLVFKRLHAPRQYPGTGIGLAICKRVVERRGGRIWVEPAEGGGSVFRFTLPAEGAVRREPERELALSR